MNDSEIIAMFNARNERAISETAGKYGRYCRRVALNILADEGEAEECLNDTWLSAWNSIPPQKPSALRVFLGRITRNLSFDRWRKAHAGKRGSGQMEIILSELEECVSDGSVEAEIDRRELAFAISEFLRELPEMKRDIFVRRYWYCDSVSEIAASLGIKPGSAAVTLQRLREKLKDYLTERGFDI